MSPAQIAAYSAALIAILGAIANLVVSIRTNRIAGQTHAMVKEDASPEALKKLPAPPTD